VIHESPLLSNEESREAAMKVVIASRNQGKCSEYARMFATLNWEVLSLDHAGIPPGFILPEEGSTFEANAYSKASAVAPLLAEGFALGDDSGLEVDVLSGAPGVFSARYSGLGKTEAERARANIAKLLSDLKGFSDDFRKARFVCQIVMIDVHGHRIDARGTCEGCILHAPRGKGGFGYDPVFLPNGFDRSMAELSLDEKNRISHRGQAMFELAKKVSAL
jgi:XTP/dITP diphosphohydrolase